MRVWNIVLHSAFVADEVSRQGQLFAQRGNATAQRSSVAAAAEQAASRLRVAEAAAPARVMPPSNPALLDSASRPVAAEGRIVEM
jgi:hypothetical protein